MNCSSTAFVTLLLVTSVGAARFAQAQAGEEQYTTPNFGWVGKDYFTRGTIPSVQKLVENVERNHMNKRFVERPGALQYSEGDMRYALWVFPNHPKALHIVSAQALQTNTPNLPIPFFEMALQLYPLHAYTHAQYGHYLVQIGAIRVGIRELQLALELEPDLAIAQAWLADANAKHTQGSQAP